MNYNHRFIARITVESETPISVGSGEKGISTDRLIAKDANGLPYIPGTALTGVLRHSFNSEIFVNDIFGSGGNDGSGSRLIISSALLVGEDGKTVIEGLKNINTEAGYYSYFNRLPERDHVRMTDKGAADTANHGKYDEELVHKGTRFVFEIELMGNEADKSSWEVILQQITSPVFRIGAGTRKGFGKLKVIQESSKKSIFDLNKEEGLKGYLQKSSSLNDSTKGWSDLLQPIKSKSIPSWKCYSFKLSAKDFFLFGAGFGDDDADNKPKTERFFEWETGKPVLTKKEYLLIPATSVKGVLSHRTAYHYNKLKEIFIGDTGKTELESSLDIDQTLQELENEFNIDGLQIASDSDEWNILKEKIDNLKIEDLKSWEEFNDNLNEEVLQKKEGKAPTGENNEAVKALFGYAKDSGNNKEGVRGKVIINDIYLFYDIKNDKVFNHTKIDRFTGGTIDGALFQEKATYYSKSIPFEIWVNEEAFKSDSDIQKAFEAALGELKQGQLPLGGNTAKGHGVFMEVEN